MTQRSEDAWTSPEGLRLREKLDMIEKTFTAIRDHKDASRLLSGRADFGQGRAADLRVFLDGLLKRRAGR